MEDIFVLAEHRQGELRDITFEMLTKGKAMAEETGTSLAAVLLGHGVGKMAEQLKDKANRVILVEDPRLETYNSEAYERVLAELLEGENPRLLLIGHTAFGMDLAPSLATRIRVPIATDCIDVTIRDGEVRATRQVYGGKLNVEVRLKPAPQSVITIRPASFTVEEYSLTGEIVTVASPMEEEIVSKRFVEYVEAAAGEVDITQANILVSVGRGIKDQDNIPMVKELADALGAALSCSRPVVDKKWLPKERQVGTSGKTVKPKVYIAIGISGAFQHVAGMKGSGTIIAINKDPKAPIFSVAHYGIVGDLFKIVPALKEKVKEVFA
ncbi:MAG: electron transfer flavoprotein subunit alpha/FixB family protein [Deltaproteobacteria bacterium]|nr:electron transfer flavoprotein subunit alpha/FixB family protein [Deltaproteobacteria bacterium]MBW2120939.1 electron transfer flavoprotein subunit alpha/FixB family protein [Deltaproteobacteria bacterium]